MKQRFTRYGVMLCTGGIIAHYPTPQRAIWKKKDLQRAGTHPSLSTLVRITGVTAKEILKEART